MEYLGEFEQAHWEKLTRDKSSTRYSTARKDESITKSYLTRTGLVSELQSFIDAS